MRWIACVFAAGLVALASSPAVAGGAPYRIKTGSTGTVARIGPYNIERTPTLGAAISAFGDPSRRNLIDDNACVVRWATLGLKITFVNFGLPPEGKTVCSGKYGFAQVFLATGRRFASSRGLRPGMATSTVLRRHPDAERHANSYWLSSYISPFGDNRRLPAVRAFVRGGKVRGLGGWIGAGGD